MGFAGQWRLNTVLVIPVKLGAFVSADRPSCTSQGETSQAERVCAELCEPCLKGTGG